MFSEKILREINNLSQSVAIDMGEGGDDKECVAEMVICVMSGNRQHDPNDELLKMTKRHGYCKVLRETMKHVCTL
jgi:hypothetical protein